MRIDLVVREFFDACVADICRAVDGRSLVGAFTLCACAIDALGHLYDAIPGQETAKNFRKWVEDFMVPVSPKCDPARLYALRCGLAHSYGFANALRRAGVSRYGLVHDRVPLHWDTPTPDSFTLNLESLIAELTVAAHGFFQTAQTDAVLGARVEQQADVLIARHVLGRPIESRGAASVSTYTPTTSGSEDPRVYSPRPVPHVVPATSTEPIRAMPPSAFGDMHPALASLDAPQGPQVRVLIEAIQAIYRRWK